MDEKSPQMRGRPTIRDVAKYAGVSYMTVSRVINDSTAVKPQTREIVTTAIEALNFSPNQAAQHLASAEYLRVALLHRFPNRSRMGEYLIDFMEQAYKLHAILLVQQIPSHADDEMIVRDLAMHGIQAVVLAPPLADDRGLVELLRAKKFVVVATGSSRSTAHISSVGIDDQGAASAVTNHLLALGHRRIGYIKGDPSHASTELRLSGFYSALENAGIAVEEALVVEGKYTYHSGLLAAERLLDLETPPTAIFASNDDMAAAAIAVAHRRKINVPRQLSVCGFDDSPLATTIWPELTTVRQPTAEVAKVALNLLFAEMALERLRPLDAPSRLVLPYEILIRSSDAPPP